MKPSPRTIEISRPSKVLFPADGITKAELVEYYRQIGPVMLRHIRNRPITMHRFPDGIDRPGFIQQQIPDYFPDWINRVTVPKEGGSVTHVVCNSGVTLVYLASQACITLHAWLSRVDAIDCPDQMIFDLDPSTDDFEPVRACALDLRGLLTELGLASFVKTTGSRGAHVVVPLKRSATFDQVRSFARHVASELARRDPQHRTTEIRKQKRGARLLVDIMRNAYGQTAVAPYSVRALGGAPVAMPLSWEEFESRDVGPRMFTMRNVREYVAARGDAWRRMARYARSIEYAAQRLAATA